MCGSVSSADSSRAIAWQRRSRRIWMHGSSSVTALRTPQLPVHHAGYGARVIEVPRLTDGVVTLRAHCEDDVQGSLEQGTDPLSVRWTRVPVPYVLDDAKRFVREVMPGGWATDEEWGFAI